jgi:RNA binding exosome subunit
MSLLKTLNLLLEVVDGSSEFGAKLGAKLLNLLIHFNEDREKVARLMKFALEPLPGDVEKKKKIKGGWVKMDQQIQQLRAELRTEFAATIDNLQQQIQSLQQAHQSLQQAHQQSI